MTGGRTEDRPEPERSLEEVRAIVLSGLRGVPARVFLFGSHARGLARRTSDIDVAILSDDLPAGVLSEIREALEESTIPYQVDLVDLGHADPSLRERVLREGVPWNDCVKE